VVHKNRRRATFGLPADNGDIQPQFDLQSKGRKSVV